MKLRLPDYYKDFHCIADKCKDSCCVGWEIDIDEDTYDYYSSVEGPFGDRLREKIRKGKDISFRMDHDRCPFLNQNNLCDIVTNLGETSLCEICTEYPRFTLEYGDVREKCLGLSCEEAGRLMLIREEPITFVETDLGEVYECSNEDMDSLQDEHWYDDDEAEEESRLELYLEQARDHCIKIAQYRKCDIKERAIYMLLFAEHVQQMINEEKEAEILGVIQRFPLKDMEKHVEKVMNEFVEEAIHKKHGDRKSLHQLYQERLAVFKTLEVLDEEWSNTVQNIEKLFSRKETDYVTLQKQFEQANKNRDYEYEHLLVYFIFRYGMKAVYDCDYLGKIKFALASCLMIRDMDVERFVSREGKFTKEDRIDTGRIYSKEVEHSEDNLDAMSEAFVFEDVFQTKSMIEQIWNDKDRIYSQSLKNMAG